MNAGLTSDQKLDTILGLIKKQDAGKSQVTTNIEKMLVEMTSFRGAVDTLRGEVAPELVKLREKAEATDARMKAAERRPMRRFL